MNGMIEDLLADTLVIWLGTAIPPVVVTRRADNVLADRIARFPTGEL